jgi:hypothetical protein
MKTMIIYENTAGIDVQGLAEPGLQGAAALKGCT